MDSDVLLGSATIGICALATIALIVYHRKKLVPASPSNLPAEPESYFDNYSDYNKTLRTWFVTFGLGGPVLFMLHPDLAEALKADHTLKRVTVLFLVGCCLQIIVALLNKISGWELYYAYDSKNEPSSLWTTINSWFWIDTTIDIVTAGCFAWALQTILSALLADGAANLTPPSAYEVFNMRSKCADLGKLIATESQATVDMRSHYSAQKNRCYVELHFLSSVLPPNKFVDVDILYDGQNSAPILAADRYMQRNDVFERNRKNIQALLSTD